MAEDINNFTPMDTTPPVEFTNPTVSLSQPQVSTMPSNYDVRVAPSFDTSVSLRPSTSGVSSTPVASSFDFTSLYTVSNGTLYVAPNAATLLGNQFVGGNPSPSQMESLLKSPEVMSGMRSAAATVAGWSPERVDAALPSITGSLVEQTKAGLSVTTAPSAAQVPASASDMTTLQLAEVNKILADPKSTPEVRLLALDQKGKLDASVRKAGALRGSLQAKLSTVVTGIGSIERTGGSLLSNPMVAGSAGAKGQAEVTLGAVSKYKTLLRDTPGVTTDAAGNMTLDLADVSDADLVTVSEALKQFDNQSVEWSSKLNEIGNTYYDKNFFQRATPFGQTQVKWESVMGAVGLISPFVMYYLQQMENDENWNRQLELAETQRQWDREDMATMQGYRLEQIAAQGEASGTSGARSAPASGGGGYGGSGVGVA